jgi:hypothetical protein
MPDETYGDERARNLEALLRNLAARISEMDARGELLKQAGELMRLIGDVRSELFHRLFGDVVPAAAAPARTP